MHRMHTNETDNQQGAREWTERTQTNPTLPRAQLNVPRAPYNPQSNVPNVTEGSRRPPTRTRMDRTHPMTPRAHGKRAEHTRTNPTPHRPPAPQGAREWTQSTLGPQGSKGMYRTQPKEARRPQGSTGMGRKHPNEPDDPQGVTERTLTIFKAHGQNHTNEPKANGNGPKAPYNPQGAQEWAESIRTNQTTARVLGK